MKAADCRKGDAMTNTAARLGANVLAIDLAPTMLARLRARADAEGLTVQTREMDGHALDLPDDTFDVVASQYGVMLFIDLPQGVAEMVRVTRPGGRVLLTVFGPPEEIEFEEFFNRALQHAAPGVSDYPTGPPPQPFQISDPPSFVRP
jgi:ubiquinone/menaquinone biosynthesis C-methylase UbiE